MKVFLAFIFIAFALLTVAVITFSSYWFILLVCLPALSSFFK